MLLNLLTSASSSGKSGGGGSNWTTWVILGIFIVLIVVYFVWSSKANKKRQQQQIDMLNAIKPGDKIKTIGGVCGEVVAVDEEENTITISTGTDSNPSYIKFDRQAIYQTNAQIDSDKAQDKTEAKVEDKQEEKAEDDKETK